MTLVQHFQSNELMNYLTELLRGNGGTWSHFHPEGLKIAVDLPGIDPAGIYFSFTGDTLIIGQKGRDTTLSESSDSHKVVAVNSKMQIALKLAEQLAKTDSSVIISGEHGTGKDLFAGEIHHLSDRRESPLVTVPCGSLGDNGVKAQLDQWLTMVGHGTLFLDSIHDLLPTAQEELSMRLARQKRVRIICATEIDLDKLVAQGQFSEDLRDVLRGGYIELPPLRERREDIPPLAAHHVARYCLEHKIEKKTLSPALLQLLHEYRWPGNVRELVNTLEQLILTAQHRPTLFPKDLPDHIRIETIKALSASKQGL